MVSGHQDGVAAEGCCVRVVGDEDEGALAQAGADALDEEGLRLGVEGGRRLIEQEDAARTETGLVRQTLEPIYRGAVVLCDGADQSGVRLAIVNAVSSVTGLGADRICVLKRK